MKDELISAETFEIAKQKGFVKKGHFFNEDIIIPTQSLLQKWLREVHKINVYCVPTEIDETKWYHNIASSFKVYTGSYEEVLEVGLQEGLKLIK